MKLDILGFKVNDHQYFIGRADNDGGLAVTESVDGRLQIINRFTPEELEQLLVKRNYIDPRDTVAAQIWTKEDIESKLNEMGYKDTPEQVKKVIKTGYLGALNAATDSDWEIIEQAIENTPKLEKWVLQATNIVWDTDDDDYDDEKPDLPDSIEIPPEIYDKYVESGRDDDVICDWLSDTYEFLVESFNIEKLN